MNLNKTLNILEKRYHDAIVDGQIIAAADIMYQMKEIVAYIDEKKTKVCSKEMDMEFDLTYEQPVRVSREHRLASV